MYSINILQVNQIVNISHMTTCEKKTKLLCYIPNYIQYFIMQFQNEV